MAAPVLVIKGALIAKKHWKKIAVIAFAVIMVVVFLPIVALTSFLPSADDQMKEKYQAVTKNTGLDWIELVVYDTVRNQNDFSKVNIDETPFDFLKLSYTISQKEESNSTSSRTTSTGETEYEVSFRGGATSWMTSAEISALPSGSYSYVTSTTVTWTVIDSGTVSSYGPVVSALKKLGYSGSEPVRANDVFNFVKGLSGQEYQASVERLTMIDLINSFDETQKEWAFELYTTLIDDNDSFGSGSTREFYNTDPAFMASIKLDSSKYRLGNVKKCYGDTDVDPVFLGRLAAIAEDYKKDAGITSGYRSVAEQQKIWDKTPVERRGKYVAAPGHSRHQYGLAADVKSWLLYVSNAQLEKYGLWKPMSYENWHIEPIETKTAA